MDSVTHIVLGASVGELILGKKAGKKAMVFGALAASAPDADAFVNFFVSDLDSLLMHRGITHSVFVGLLIGPLLGWLIWKMYNKQEGALIPWIMLVTVNILLHDLLDTCTVYGTALLSPFSDHRFSFDNIFVADPLYTIPLIVSVTALIILRSDNVNRRNWNAFGIGLSSVYLVFTFMNHSAAINALSNSIDLNSKSKHDYFAAPTLFNSILWNVVVRDGNDFKVGYYSVFDKEDKIALHTIPGNNHLISQVPDTVVVKKLALFASGFYCMTQREGQIIFNDLRFGQVQGWSDPKSNFAFAFDLTPDADNKMVVQLGRIEGTRQPVLESMWERMKGN